MRDGVASRTAVLVCQGRAVAHGRLAPERFADPIARALLRDDELVAVDAVRRGEPPSGLAARVEFERLRAVADVVVPRTVAIDDAVRADVPRQLVILGAGLDARAWRMPELAETDVFEVDAPGSQHDKRTRLGGRRPLAPLRFVPVDFSTDDLGGRLAAAGFRDDVPTTWVWEGVVAYLRPAEVAATLDSIHRASAVGSRLVVNYQSRSVRARVGRAFAGLLTAVSRADDPMVDEPMRSTWTAASMRELLRAHGFDVRSDEDLGAVAESLRFEHRSRSSVSAGRVAVAVC